VQVGTVDVLHDQEVAGAVAVGVVGGHDVGVVQLGDGADLAVEALHRAGVAGLAGRQQLDRDAAAHEGVLAEEDLPHAAGAEGPEDLVLAAEDEVAVAPGQELVGLEAGQKPLVDEGVGQVGR
jgi:hypothetical protein